VFEITGSGDTIIIAEGFATAATVAEATRSTVVATFSDHNLEAAARAVREHNPVAKIIIAADDDRKTELEIGRNPGLRAAEKAAKAVGATVVAPPFDREKDGDEPSDWNDFARIYGAGDVAPAFRWVCNGAREHITLDGVRIDADTGEIIDRASTHDDAEHAEKPGAGYNEIETIRASSLAGKSSRTMNSRPFSSKIGIFQALS
jgi:phage/plasmid primase-like uncharacterized protein